MTKNELAVIKQAVEVLELYQESDLKYPIKVLPLLREVARNHDKKALQAIVETPAQRFVGLFGKVYQQCTGNVYKTDSKTFILATKLIKDYGYDAVLQKAKILAIHCKEGKVWFVKDSWGSFTIETLSARWNNLLPIVPLTPEEIKDKKYQEELKKWEGHDAAINKAFERTGQGSDRDGAGTSVHTTGQAVSTR